MKTINYSYNIIYFVTDTQINLWDNKASASIVTTSTNGLMSSIDKNKLDNISFSANKTSTSEINGNIKIDNIVNLLYYQF